MDRTVEPGAVALRSNFTSTPDSGRECGGFVDRYARLLTQVHRRLEIIEGLADGRIDLGMRARNVGSMARQWRAALQATVLGAFLGPPRVFANACRAFATEHRASDILRKLARMHGDFYPRRAELRCSVAGEPLGYVALCDSFGPQLLALVYDRSTRELDAPLARATQAAAFVSNSPIWTAALREQLASHIAVPIHRARPILIELSASADSHRHFQFEFPDVSSTRLPATYPV